MSMILFLSWFFLDRGVMCWDHSAYFTLSDRLFKWYLDSTRLAVNKYQNHWKTAFYIYFVCHCLRLKYVWWSETLICNKNIKKLRNQDGKNTSHSTALLCAVVIYSLLSELHLNVNVCRRWNASVNRVVLWTALLLATPTLTGRPQLWADV